MFVVMLVLLPIRKLMHADGSVLCCSVACCAVTMHLAQCTLELPILYTIEIVPLRKHSKLQRPTLL